MGAPCPRWVGYPRPLMTANDGKQAWRRLAAEIRATSTPGGRERFGRFSIEGLRLVERALRADWPVEQLLVAEELVGAPGERVREVLIGLERRGAKVVPAPDAELAELCGGRDLGRMLALLPLPPARRLAEVLAAGVRSPALLLVLVDVAEPGNVGALIRTAHASGADACVCVGVSDPLHPKALRTSMGSAFRLPTVRCASFDELEPELRGLGIATLGAVSSAGAPPWTLDYDRPLAILFGSEAFGLSEELQARLDGVVSIPMPDQVDSYSVNAAAAVLLYEARRPR